MVRDELESETLRIPRNRKSYPSLQHLQQLSAIDLALLLTGLQSTSNGRTRHSIRPQSRLSRSQAVARSTAAEVNSASIVPARLGLKGEARAMATSTPAFMERVAKTTVNGGPSPGKVCGPLAKSNFAELWKL